MLLQGKLLLQGKSYCCILMAALGHRTVYLDHWQRMFLDICCICLLALESTESKVLILGGSGHYLFCYFSKQLDGRLKMLQSLRASYETGLLGSVKAGI